MKIIILSSFMLIASQAISVPLFADNWSGQISIANDYNRRGIRISTNDDVKSALLEYEIDSGFYLGAWIADLDLAPSTRGNIQLDYFVGYSQAINNDLHWDATFIHYTNPKSESNINYDWNEWVTSLHFQQRATLTVGVNDNWIGREKTTQFAELIYRYPLPFEVISDISLGYNKTEKVLGTNYAYYELGINKAFERLRIRAALTGADDRAQRIFGEFRTQSRWNFSLAWTL